MESGFGIRDSGIVRIERTVHNPLLRPRVLWARQTYLAIAYQDGSDPIPLRFREEREMHDGQSILVEAHGMGSDSTLTPGDTARVRMETVFAAGSLRRDRKATFTAILGDNPRRFGDWRMLRYSMESHLATGPLASVHFSARLDTPSEPGQLRAEGEFDLRAELQDGAKATLEGTFRERRLEATLMIEEADGARKYRAIWDEAGKVVEAEER
jgi:hypothetical protein